MKTTSRKTAFKVGTLLFGLTTLLFFVQFLLYIKGSNILPVMDFGGWIFFITSCLSHAACVALVPFLVYMPFALIRQMKVGLGVMTTLNVLLSVLIFLNMQVYDLYRFHINGFVLNMVFGTGASDIFTFDTMLYIKEGAIWLLLVAVSIALCMIAYRLREKCRAKIFYLIFSLVIGSTLFAHIYHIYASFKQKPSVIKSSLLIPYYFPTTSYGLMIDLGFTPPH